MNKVPVLVAFACLSVMMSCQSETKDSREKYPKHLGEIPFDRELDDPNFKLCDSAILVQSRLALSYVGGFSRLAEICKTNYAKAAKKEDYTGIILVRFIVNCENETGRFRFQTLDEAFLHQECPEALVNRVKKCVQALEEWVFLIAENKGKDHSHYLNFKIIDGEIKSIIH
jgi:hypothetical protein